MKYGLIGEKLSHSFSPRIHNLLGNKDYQLKELHPSELDDFILSEEYDGLNITIPYKKRVMPLLDVISQEAAVIGSVNTIVRRDGRLYGYNTDFFGLKELISHSGLQIEEKNVLVLGAGGAGVTAVAVAEQLGAARIDTAVRTPQNGQLLIVNSPDVPEYAYYQIIINATPVGMFPGFENSPVDIKAFPKLEGVIDCVYNPLRSQLVLDAQHSGLKAEGGLYMLVAQACKSHEIFTGNALDGEIIDTVYKQILEEIQNIVLCGMPSSGKSTLGKEISLEKGKPFIDTDILIVGKTGKSITDIFRDEGEACFRDIESEIISELATKQGVVIALGGGAVLRRENVNNLKRNGKIVFINKPLDQLTTSADRPLSQTPEALAQLYEQRLPFYLAVADEML